MPLFPRRSILTNSAHPTSHNPRLAHLLYLLLDISLYSLLAISRGEVNILVYTMRELCSRFLASMLGLASRYVMNVSREFADESNKTLLPNRE